MVKKVQAAAKELRNLEEGKEEIEGIGVALTWYHLLCL